MALLDPLEVILCVFAWQSEQKKNHDMERVHIRSGTVLQINVSLCVLDV